MAHTYSPTDELTTSRVRITCDDCGKVYHDENYAGEACRDCGSLLLY